VPSVFESILNHLKQPEYVHVLLNPLPIYGIALGIVALVVSMFLKTRRAHITALVILLIGAGSTIPVVYFGNEGYDAIDAQISDSDQADAWLDAHGQRAMEAMPWFYALIALTLAALFIPWKWPKTNLVLNCLALALAIVDFGLAGWIGYAGGQAMHKEFRAGMPPEPVGGYDKVRW
jgi:hypothetical protein